jgi:DNA polymerase III subunit delta'
MWRGIFGHDHVLERFRRTLRSGRLASTYLFVGPEGIGKRRFALELAKALLCPKLNVELVAACDHCESCRLYDAGNHPDLEVIGLLPGKQDLAIGQFLGDEALKIPVENSLCHRIALKPFLGGRRVAIIDDADHFNPSSANCLLKTLEEPPPDSVLILIGTSLGRQLPTIRSRSQVITFQPLAPNDLRQLLLQTGIAADEVAAAKLAAVSDGSLTLARELSDPEMWDFRILLLERIARPRADLAGFEKAVVDFVQAAGSESADRRARLRSIIGFAVEYFRARLKEQAESAAELTSDGHGVPSSPLLALDACLSASELVDRNVNQGLIVADWLARLSGNAGRISQLVA